MLKSQIISYLIKFINITVVEMTVLKLFFLLLNRNLILLKNVKALLKYRSNDCNFIFSKPTMRKKIKNFIK